MTKEILTACLRQKLKFKGLCPQQGEQVSGLTWHEFDQVSMQLSNRQSGTLSSSP